MVTHAFNPSYSGDRDWEDCISMLSQEKNHEDPHLNK
jgi:hypothetical protein